MKLKVIKEIKGLVPGDMLDYNEKEDSYEIYKIDEDISDNGHSKQTLLVSIDAWLIEYYKDYFQLTDNNGEEIKIEKLTLEDITPKITEHKSNVVEIVGLGHNDDEIRKLHQEVEELKKELAMYKETPYAPPIYRVCYTHPYRTIFDW